MVMLVYRRIWGVSINGEIPNSWLVYESWNIRL